jgi:plastocyanin
VRKPFILVVLVVAGALLSVLSATAFAATRVKVGDNYFVRPTGVPTVTVDKGTRVKWVWKGMNTHNVRSVSGPARVRSESMTSGAYSKRMRERGSYTIICTIHGGSDQKMKLVVK